MSESAVAEKKMTKTAAIRQAINELGMEADVELLRARAQELGKCEIKDKQRIYTEKYLMRKEGGEVKKAPAERKAKRPAVRVEKISKVIKAPRPKTNAQETHDVLASIQAVRTCIEVVGSKEVVMEILRVLA